MFLKKILLVIFLCNFSYLTFISVLSTYLQEYENITCSEDFSKSQLLAIFACLCYLLPLPIQFVFQRFLEID